MKVTNHIYHLDLAMIMEKTDHLELETFVCIWKIKKGVFNSNRFPNPSNFIQHNFD